MTDHCLRRRLLLAAAALPVGCATAPGGDKPAMSSGAEDGWHAVGLPGKASTHYQWKRKDGRTAIAAEADRSASMWRRKVAIPADRLGQASFSWRVDRLIPGASLSDADRADAPARVLFAFGGDVARLSARNRVMFELAHALTGEAPPYATLMYVWEASAPVGSVIVSPRTDRIRKIVLDSGAEGLGGWRHHRRSLVPDFRLAFGEDPGPLMAVAVMTDADNTRSTAQAWYSPIEFN